MRRKNRVPLALFALPLFACASTQQTAPPQEGGGLALAAEEAPSGQLPREVTPLHYALDLDIDPREERFAGRVRIQARIDDTRDHIWLHGKDLQVSEATVTSGDEVVPAAWVLIEADTGLARIDLDRPVGPGDVEIALAYDAPFGRNLNGLYKVETGGESYAFTQFESHFARQCFPGFDEPRFKTPYDITVTSRQGDVVITTTPQTERAPAGEGKERLSFGTTKPLPSYLIAFAVGPLDVVDPGPLAPNAVRKQPLPFRGVAAKGKGQQLAYALANTAPLLEALEVYFGQPYPFEKLDIIAVPDFSSGAMENVGAITFREVLLLLDAESAPIEQQKAFASVMAHELAHMWFGNLVTMPWWDDIWLNEAFATWMAARIVHEVHPEHQADIAFLERVQGAMGQDSLVSARQIRQPIESTHDIRNAFDSITYRKGGGVLAMFERYLGEETFRDGLRRYMARHRFGSATYEDLLGALSEAAGQDVTTPFKTFLFQPGLPALEAHLSCGDKPALTLKQSRFLPVGSEGDRAETWQLPVCARYGMGEETKEACTLLTKAEGELPLEGCPTWVMPNAAGAGYYRFSQPKADLQALLSQGSGRLDAKERLALADALSGAFAAATVPAEDILGRIPALASDESRAVALLPAQWLSFAHAHLVDAATRPRVKAFAGQSYRPVLERLGLTPKGESESGETREFRNAVLAFLALSVEDEDALTKAAALGRTYVGFGTDGELHEDAVEPSLVGTALAAAVRKDGAPFVDALLARFDESEDALLRSRILTAIASTKDPGLAARARALTLDARLRGNERLPILFTQASQPETLEDTWAFVTDRFDALAPLLPDTHKGALPWVIGTFCDEDKASQAEAFFAPRAEQLPGAPRNLASALEGVRLCSARVKAHRASAARFFAKASDAAR